MSKRSCSEFDTNLSRPCKRQKLMEDEKDCECECDDNLYVTVIINGKSDLFLLSDLIKIEFFASRFSSNWNQQNENMEKQRECIIDCKSINFGISELKMVINYLLSSKSSKLSLNEMMDNLFSSKDNFSKLLQFLNCLDFFCISSLINIDILCNYYYDNNHNETITMSDLYKLQKITNNKLLISVSRKLISNIYRETMSERIISLKENIMKFKIDIDSGFIIKDDRDASDWLNKKINEFCLYRRYLSRDWIIINKSHKSLQELFNLNNLYSIFTNIKDIFDIFCRFCTIKHMKQKSNDVINIDHQQKKSNILNEVKICTFPIIQLMLIFKYYLSHFSDYDDNKIYLKQTMDLISLLPTILKCELFCGLKKDDDEYKHCDRDDDMRFIKIIYDNNNDDDDDLYKQMIKIYKDIINILLNEKLLNNDISIIETLILPITDKIMDDQQWILNLFKKSNQKETILLASKLRELILDLKLNGHHLNYTYINNIQSYLSYQ